MLEVVNLPDLVTRRPMTGAGPRPGRARIVALGGGTGLAVVLRGLCATCGRPAAGDQRDWLTAIVTVADDGGSSGKLRLAYRMLAPGDIRECLLALSGGDITMQALFDYRFNGMVGGHSLGNLILTALAELERDFVRAVGRAGELLGASGTVLPSTYDEVALLAEFMDGSCVRGESRIAPLRRRIRRVSLVPGRARATPEAVDAILSAGTIVIGPGSLYTSVIPTLLVRDIARAIARAHARVIVVQNLMTEPGETDGYSASDFIMALRRHAPQLPLDMTLLTNTTPVSPQRLQRYAAEGATPVRVDADVLADLGCRVVGRDLLGSGPLARHDPLKLGRAVQELAGVEAR